MILGFMDLLSTPIHTYYYFWMTQEYTSDFLCSKKGYFISRVSLFSPRPMSNSISYMIKLTKWRVPILRILGSFSVAKAYRFSVITLKFTLLSRGYGVTPTTFGTILSLQARGFVVLQHQQSYSLYFLFRSFITKQQAEDAGGGGKILIFKLYA
jgi:hypothetical protein